MSDIIPLTSAIDLDAQRAERLDRELAEAEGTTRMLRQHLELLAGIQIPPSASTQVFHLVCGESSRVVTAMSRLRAAHAASVTALARLRQATHPRHVVIEHRYPDDGSDQPGGAA